MKKVLATCVFVIGILISAYNQTVTIGRQVWMKQNLNISKFRNGDIIYQAKTKAEWIRAGSNKQPAWCYFEFNPANGIKFGKLYNWYAVNDSRILEPLGWHIATSKEWLTLQNALEWNYNYDELGNPDDKLKSTSGWFDNRNGNNHSGFTALPGGECEEGGGFPYIGQVACWWTREENDERYALSIKLGYWSMYNGNLQWNESAKKLGMSVRCVRDSVGVPPPLTRPAKETIPKIVADDVKEYEIPKHANIEQMTLNTRLKFSECNKSVKLKKSSSFYCENNNISVPEALVYQSDKYTKLVIKFKFSHEKGNTIDEKQTREFYYENGKLFFIYVYSVDEDRSIGLISKNENRYYIQNNSIFKFLVNKEDVKKVNKLNYTSTDPELNLINFSTGNLNEKNVCALLK